MKRKKVIYFISGRVPSEKERKEAEALGASCFRNVQLIRSGDNPEDCDAVAGKVPSNYKDKPLAGAPVAAEGGQGGEGGQGAGEPDKDAIKAELDALGVSYRANAKLETLQELLAEAKADPTA